MSDDKPPLSEAIAMVGLVALARGVGLTHRALRKWEAAGRMPRTEWTGETRYAELIEQLTDGRVTKARLLAPWPKPQPAKPIERAPQPEHAAAAAERRHGDRRQSGEPPAHGHFRRTTRDRRREWR